MGTVFASRYELEVLLGAGAMGAVYRARHIRIGRQLAIKVLHSRVTAPKVVQRFEREAELAGKLQHPNVVPVVDLNTSDDGEIYLVMDFVDGQTLAALLNDTPMPQPRAIWLAHQLCDGLEHAHGLGLVHRDFKPENVIVARDSRGFEQPRIVDFGVAILRDQMRESSGEQRLTTDGMVVGTPHYMSPEQVRGDAVDGRSDLFALGIILYELLTGKLPFDGDGVDVARANLMGHAPQMRTRAPTLEIDPLLEALVAKLMEKDPARRPQTAREARELLELIERDRGAAMIALGLAQPDPPPAPVRNFKTGRRKRIASWQRIAAMAVIALLLLVSVALLVRRRDEPPRIVRIEAPAKVVTVPVPMPAPPMPSPVPPPAVTSPAPSPQPTHPVVAARAQPSTPGAPLSPPTAAELAAQYREVGNALKKREDRGGSVDDLWSRYRWIRLADYLATADKRASCHDMLDRLTSDLSRR
ncbi:MAG: serine/threonine protein kinase [Deltaproteobacteria bacterium]|nr:serine/threonine protein kinase [Deltaproteobacteria bacterium]